MSDCADIKVYIQCAYSKGLLRKPGYFLEWQTNGNEQRLTPVTPYKVFDDVVNGRARIERTSILKVKHGFYYLGRRIPSLRNGIAASSPSDKIWKKYKFSGSPAYPQPS